MTIGGQLKVIYYCLTDLRSVVMATQFARSSRGNLLV